MNPFSCAKTAEPVVMKAPDPEIWIEIDRCPPELLRFCGVAGPNAIGGTNRHAVIDFNLTAYLREMIASERHIAVDRAIAASFTASKPMSAGLDDAIKDELAHQPSIMKAE